MDRNLLRLFGIELVGAFGLIYISSGLVCINQVTTSLSDVPGTAPLTLHQPGVFGIALGQGLILAALLALTAPVTGGYLNPAITLTLWVFGRLETPRAAGLMIAQLAGSVLAAVCLRYTFSLEVLKIAQFGAPHLNPLTYQPIAEKTLATGTIIELVLTFFLVFAIFGLAGTDSFRLGLTSGMIATACALFALPLTGGAFNPARWLGPTLLEALTSTSTSPRGPWADSLVYLAGPILGALAGGLFVFKVYQTSDKK